MYYIHKRKNRFGEYYSFSYVDSGGKRIRLKRDEHPHFTDRRDAETWAKIQSAGREIEKAKIERRMAWRDKYYTFDTDLIPIYEQYQQRNAPNSYENSIRYLRMYVMPWFLSEKKANNLDSWHFHFQEFRDWVEFKAKKLRRDELLSYSSKNQVIHSLNTFLECMSRYGKMNADNAKTCEIFPASKLTSKNYESVIELGEFHAVCKWLSVNSQNCHDFFHVLYLTGLRHNELMSVSMDMLKAGSIEGPIGEELQKCGITTHGYIVLSSQVERFSHGVEKRVDGTDLQRKPLKGRPRIAPEFDRIIPIEEKECWNILATRWKTQESEFERRAYGSKLSNYLLFEGCNYTRLSKDLEKAYAALDFPRKTFHDCRHSFCTNFVGRTRSFFLARQILGHKSEAFERYLHIYEKSALMNKAKKSKIEIVS